MKKIPKIRRTWKRNPRTRVKGSAKIYSRYKKRKEVDEALGEELWRKKKQKPGRR